MYEASRVVAWHRTVERRFAEVELVAMVSAVMGLLGRVGLAKRGVPWNPWNCNTWPETTADWTLKSHRPHSPLQSCTQVIYSIHVADRQVLVVDVVGYRR